MNSHLRSRCLNGLVLSYSIPLRRINARSSTTDRSSLRGVGILASPPRQERSTWSRSSHRLNPISFVERSLFPFFSDIGGRDVPSPLSFPISAILSPGIDYYRLFNSGGTCRCRCQFPRHTIRTTAQREMAPKRQQNNGNAPDTCSRREKPNHTRPRFCLRTGQRLCTVCRTLLSQGTASDRPPPPT
ncbi:hypothetical protein GALMADRAFT_844354 [Galerina marginata CBS 339.88]|uniref:Uncharacterized protein n=1 Tax=Galerina marginata (strain CBS 339.88) TaxID=685588 RepID=A0A067TUR7_GALM3|nr:hypothetical protein GALMADRAFT_844354 [Galerina marginata CBS 339.88]